jgi:hypothetical protein
VLPVMSLIGYGVIARDEGRLARSPHLAAGTTSEGTDRIRRDRICIGFAGRSFRKALVSLCKEAVAVVVERKWVPLL